MIAAIKEFVSNFTNNNFNGTVKIQELTATILDVAGVSRFEYASNGIRCRPGISPLSMAMVVSQNGIYNTDSGYLIPEDSPGQTLNETITTVLE